MEHEDESSETAEPPFRKVFAAMPSACLLLDRELTIVAATDAFLRATQMTQESLLGRPLSSVFPDREIANDVDLCPVDVRASIENVFAGGQGNALPVQRLRMARVDGSGDGYVERHVRRSNHAVAGAPGEVLFVVHQIEDVTNVVELVAAREAADRASAAKSQFLSSMSHELRTPLNSMLGFAQLLARDRHEPLSRRHAERIAQVLRGGEHLIHLLSDILDLSRVEMNGISISVEPINVLEVLGDVVDMLAPDAHAAGVTLEVRPGGVGVPPVSADRTRYTQMLVNLGSNGIKYNRSGGSVTFALSFQEDEQLVYVRVADTGLGIAPDKHDLIFRPFERAGQELGSIEGSGIGLALTKRLAELMGGDVGFTSTPGVGSEFWIRIPVHEQRRTSAPPPASTVEARLARRRG